MRKTILAIFGALASIVLTVLFAAPASAAGIPNTAVPGTETNTYVRQTETVTDAGGQVFTVSVLWTETYETAAHNFRVGATIRINAVGVDLDTADNPGDGGLDATVKGFDGFADGHIVLHTSRNFDGADDPLNYNVANLLNRPGVSKYEITAGVNDDGKKNSPKATFVQPVIGDEDPGADGEGPEGP